MNGTIPTATNLGSVPVTFAAAIGDEPIGSLDVDMYAVTVVAGETVGFDIDAEELGWGLDADLRLFDQSGNELAFSYDETDPESGIFGDDPYIEYTFAAGGKYFLAFVAGCIDLFDEDGPLTYGGHDFWDVRVAGGRAVLQGAAQTVPSAIFQLELGEDGAGSLQLILDLASKTGQVI